MGEFTKFLPGVLDGSLKMIRQLFYLPPFALSVSIALLAGAKRLQYHRWTQIAALALAVPVSLQILPPAWSPSNLLSAEFRLQAAALVLCWLLLASFWLLGRLPLWLSAGAAAALALAAALLAAFQFLAVRPAIGPLYGTRPQAGWGLMVCVAGLALLAGVGTGLAILARPRSVRN